MENIFQWRLIRRAYLFKTVLLLGFLSIVSVQGEIEWKNEKEEVNRESKLFVSVSVPPTPCGMQNEGVCLPKRKCTQRSGTLVGQTCAQGFGECCSFSVSGNATFNTVDVTQYVTLLKAPMPINTPITFRIRRGTGSTSRSLKSTSRQNNICQVKLQFINFVSNSADDNGICSSDSLSIRGSSTVPDGFTTCGMLTGQHMYLSYGVSDTIEVRPTITRNNGDYSILATLIPCNSPLKVPDYCLQYYNTTTGTVMSFDYGSSTSQQQSNQMYTICVGGLGNGASINWKRCAQSNNAMMLDAFSIAGPSPMGPPLCDRDWIQINGLAPMCTFPPLNSPGVTSSYSPFVLNVHFDANEVPSLPWGPSVQAATDMASCTAVGAAFPNLIVQPCTWNDPTPAVAGSGNCQCDATPAANDLIGVPDIGNTGFCLDYTQM